jgi:hypothetical protein
VSKQKRRAGKARGPRGSVAKFNAALRRHALTAGAAKGRKGGSNDTGLLRAAATGRDKGPSRPERLKARLSGLPDACEARARDASAGCAVVGAERRHVEERLRRGAADGDVPSGQPVTDIVLGIDFGSTSTKVVARLPYHAGSPAAAMPVPASAQAEGNPNLWFSRLWLHPQERLDLLAGDGATAICALKTRLICSPSPDAEAHAAAFLGLIVAYARGWARERLAPIVRSGNLRWSYNFGFPADSLDQSDLADRYRRVVAAALDLSRTHCPTLEEARAALRQVSNARSRLEASATTIQPEVAAAVAAAGEATRLPVGLFMMMDVGGVTLDCCTFKLIPSDGEQRMPIYRASVETFGSECATLLGPDRQAADDLRDAIMTQLRTVIVDTYQDYMRGNPCWREGLPLLLVGGGSAHAFYCNLPDLLDDWLRGWLRIEGCAGMRVFKSPRFGGVIHDGDPREVHRLSVAIGLSKPESEIPVVTPRRDIPPLAPGQVRETSDRYVGSEMT